MSALFNLALAALLAGGAAHAQSAAPVPAAETRPAAVAETVEALATAMADNFVFPEAGTRYAAGLRARLAAGAYPAAMAPADLAAQLTQDLQAIHADRHVRVLPPGAGLPGMRTGASAGSGSPIMQTILEQGWIADGVAYVSFNAFPGDAASVESVRRFLATHADARTLILDFRRHRGGTLGEMDAILASLFTAETELVRMDTRAEVERRQGSPLEDGPTLRRLASPDTVVRRAHWAIPAPQPTALSKARVYLLTSKRTASAAEHFALAMKRTGRATLVGEQTAGAGHYGNLVSLPGGYRAFVPVGRTYDPATDRGWEGTGVTPDIAVPAEQALDEALRRAGVDPAAKRSLGTPA